MSESGLTYLTSYSLILQVRLSLLLMLLLVTVGKVAHLNIHILTYECTQLSAPAQAGIL